MMGSTEHKHATVFFLRILGVQKVYVVVVALVYIS
jgi:hypothetical protein